MGSGFVFFGDIGLFGGEVFEKIPAYPSLALRDRLAQRAMQVELLSNGLARLSPADSGDPGLGVAREIEERGDEGWVAGLRKLEMGSGLQYVLVEKGCVVRFFCGFRFFKDDWFL